MGEVDVKKIARWVVAMAMVAGCADDRDPEEQEPSVVIWEFTFEREDESAVEVERACELRSATHVRLRVDSFDPDPNLPRLSPFTTPSDCVDGFYEWDRIHDGHGPTMDLHLQLIEDDPHHGTFGVRFESEPVRYERTPGVTLITTTLVL